MTEYQNYHHYKLPITMNPLEYGKLIIKIEELNLFITQVNRTNIALIKQYDEFNHVKLFKEGDFMFEYNDHKSSENIFIRSLNNKKFTYTNNKLTLISSDKLFNRINLFINHHFIILLVIYFWLNFDINNSEYLMLSTSIIKLRKVNSIHAWKTLEFSIDNLLFTTDLFKSKFNIFWNKIENNFTEDNHMFILFKIKYKGSDYTTIGNLQRINSSDKIWYLNWIINNMIYKSEYYNEIPIVSFIFSYGFKDGIALEKEVITSNFQHYKNNKLVISYNPLDYGKLVSEIKWENYTQFILQTIGNLLVNINKYEDYNEINLISGGETILKFRDEFISENKFVRIIDNKKYYFENNKEILYIKEMKTKFISKTKPSKNLVNNFITLDIETYVKDNILVPFCISIYDGNISKTYSLNDYKNPEDLIITALKSIMIRKYNRSNVYIHNMAKFDIIFLLKYLVKLGLVHPIIHNGRIISINFNFGKNGEYQIQFRDSYLLLLNSLRKLCKSFSVENSKSIFPHFFVNENNLDYIGDVPDLKYFDETSKSEYNKYKSNFNNNWNLKDESRKYCELDCISLHQVITRFNDMIFDLFRKNVHHYPTLPSLAFAIFRSRFMKEENIPQLSGKIADDIRSGYTGGSCDVFIPKSKPGVKIKGYDVNALYPSQMLERLMPIGKPSYFYGDIRKIDPNAFGFFYCKIIAPNDIKHPILQTHVKTSSGIRTISPIGNWEDMIFSSEMDNAIKYGYNFEILWGYSFNSEIIFKEYVDFLYILRTQYEKSNPLNFIAKILLNSLYGRFGMDDNFLEINVIHKDYYPDFENKFFDDIIECVELGDYKLVKYRATKLENNEESTHNVSIGIAAAITAYSRIHMTQFKNNPKINLYYTDTDSAYTDSDINDSFISETILGKLKLENICNKAIFLAPKLYCLETIDEKVIYKVKGLKHEVELTMNDFEKLLNKDAFITKSQTKWTRNLSEGHIKLLEQVYTLKMTDNKRQLIYDKNGKFIATRAYKINKDKIIIE